VSVLAGATLLTFAGLACGRPLPEDEPAATGPVETGAFELGEPSDAAGGALSGRIEIDGSSTVAPITTLAAERFRTRQPDVRVTVGVSGTGGGFERFCRGETDLSDASRPIKDEEEEVCEKAGIESVEFQIANDALTVVVNSDNDWADCLTVDELKEIWEPGSDVSSWSDIRDGFPDEDLELFGPGTVSGTFDYFTDAIVGEEGASRSDYTATEDDNVIVQGVSGDAGALGYFGFSYFEQNQDRLKAVAIDDGDGCVEPSVETAQNGTYVPLARPLFVYAKRDAFAEPQVSAFVRFMLENAAELAEDALFVPLTEAQLDRQQGEFDAALEEVGS
jgi:phosphate transport system substrate-binding protein